MANFYGTVQGNRGMASRLGTKSSGLAVTAQSWDGSVIVRMYEEDGRTIVYIGVGYGSTACSDATLYHGSIEGLQEKLEKISGDGKRAIDYVI